MVLTAENGRFAKNSVRFRDIFKIAALSSSPHWEAMGEISDMPAKTSPRGTTPKPTSGIRTKLATGLIRDIWLKYTITRGRTPRVADKVTHRDEKT